MGILWIDEEDRFMATRELLIAMGYPCTPRTEEAVGSNEPMTSFSKMVPAPSTRTRSTTCSQIGNAMHVNVMGMYEMTALLLLPLGSPLSSFAAAQEERRKRRKLAGHLSA